MALVSPVHHRPSSITPTIVVDGVPFSRYALLNDDNKYVFHASQFGMYVLSGVEDKNFRRNLVVLTNRLGIELPNGGTAFYYPNNYPLNRMRGPELIYSAYSQASILQGYLPNHILQNNADSQALLNRVLRAMFFPYEEGGIDLGVAQLELPLYRSNPEIILNGWLYALLALFDYAHVMAEPLVAQYVRRNLEFFADNNEVWYDDNHNISRYSDTSPHRIHLRVSSVNQSFGVIYRSKVSELRHYLVKPVLDLENKYSAFDVRLNHLGAGNSEHRRYILPWAST